MQLTTNQRAEAIKVLAGMVCFKQTDHYSVLGEHDAELVIDKVMNGEVPNLFTGQGVAALKKEIEDLNRIVGSYGGFHERSEIETRIEATLNDLENVDGGRLNDLADLLALLDAGRGRLWKETEYSRHLLGRIKAATTLLHECQHLNMKNKEFPLVERVSKFFVANERDFIMVTDAEKAYDELFYDCKHMLVNFAKVVLYPEIPSVDKPLPDFFLLKLIAFTKDKLKKYHDMEAEHPDQECHNDHVSIRFWSQTGPGDPETCPLCALKKPKADPNIGCVL